MFGGDPEDRFADRVLYFQHHLLVAAIHSTAPQLESHVRQVTYTFSPDSIFQFMLLLFI